jgi:folate-binding protein YgfZ
MKAALLPDRGVVKVSGADARKFLNGLVTSDLDRVTPIAPRFTALLTPQGKIIVDFIVAEAPAEDGGGFFLDCPRALAGTLRDKLAFYKLRAKVAVDDVSDTLGVLAVWDGTGTTESALCYPDPRLPDLGIRCILPPADAQAAAADLGAALRDAAAYDAHRISLGVPRGGADFLYGDAFPHESDMDQLQGVDFDKGCFVGQEVVSRMQHRGTARTRVVPVTFDGPPPDIGSAVTAGERPVGVMGSGVAGHGLAALRLDRVDDALASGTPLTAGGIALRPVKPAWARFAFPGEVKAAS